MLGRCTVTLLLSLVAHCQAGVHREPAEVHPGYEDQCYIRKTGDYLKPGTKKYLTGCKLVECETTKGGLYQSLSSCEASPPRSSCSYIPAHRFAVYPRCCPRYDCPPVRPGQTSAHGRGQAPGGRPTAGNGRNWHAPVWSSRRDCPSDRWMTFNGNCYWLSSHNSSWSNARDFCKALDTKADLVSIHSLEEHNFLVNTMKARHFWIGLSDLNRQGEFVWSDGSPVDFQNWFKDQPDNYRGNQHCAWIYEEFALQWDDAECPAPFAFVCKITGAA